MSNINTQNYLLPQSLETEINRKLSNLQQDFHEQELKIDELDDPLSIFDS